jgi:peroxiredoxin
LPLVQQTYENWSTKGLALYAVDISEDPSKVKAFLSNHKYSMPVLLDLTGGVSDSYGVTSIPASYFIGRDGIIKQKFIGAFPNVKAIETQLKTIIP